MLHPAIVGVIPGAGSGARTLASSSNGLNLNVLGGRNVVVQTPPRFRFVSFPTEGGEAREDLVRPSEFNDDLAAVRALLGDMQIAQTFVPARFRAEGGAVATLDPPEEEATPSPLRHYHVLVDAPGGAGEEIPLSLEGLNAAGHPLENRGRGFPPVRAVAAETLEKLDQEPREGCDAPIAGFNAYRLSSDPRDPLFNQYLSDPFALVVERLSIEELADLEVATPDRPVLWSPEYLRVGIDPEARGEAVIGPFAMQVDEAEKTFVSGASATLPTLSGFYLMGRNPPPIGGDLSQPGSLGSVSARSGEARIRDVDMTLPGRGMSIVFERTLAGQDTHHSVFGPGWDFTYGQRLVPLRSNALLSGMTIPLVIRAEGAQGETAGSGDVLLETGRGRVVLFEFKGSDPPPEIADDPLVQELGWGDNGDAFYTAETPGVFDILVGFPGGEFVRLTPDGERFWYSERGVLQRVQDRYPKNEQVLSYTRRGELRRITDRSSDGQRYLELGYFRFESDSLLEDGLDEVTSHPYVAGKVARLRDFTGRDVLFFYTEDGVLERREDVEVESAADEGFSGRQATGYQRGDDNACGALGAIVTGGGEQGGVATSPVTLVAFEYDEADDSANSEQPVVGQAKVAGQEVPLELTGENSAEAVGELTGTSSLPDESATSFEWDELGYPSQITLSGPVGSGDPAVSVPVYENGLLVKVTLPEGDIVESTYDTENSVFRARGNLLSVKRIPGPRGGDETIRRFDEYDLHYNLPKRLTDANGKVIQVTLTEDRRAAKERKPVSGIENWRHTFEYNDFGQLTNHRSPSGVVTSTGYGAEHGYATSVTTGEGTEATQITFEYDDSPAAQMGQATTIRFPAGSKLETEFNARLQPIRLTRGTGKKEALHFYDANGNLVLRDARVDDGVRVRTHFRYDDLNFLLEQRVESIDVNGAEKDIVTTYVPDELRRVGRIEHPGGQVEQIFYDHQGRPIRRELGPVEAGADKHVTERVYDRSGNVLQVFLEGELVEENTFDGHDRRVQAVQFFGVDGVATAEVEYYGEGQVRRRRVEDFDGTLLQEVRLESIDSLGRPVSRVTRGDPDTGDATVDFSYSADGRTVTETGPRDQRVDRSDTLGRMVSTKDGILEIRSEYDEVGRMESIESEADGQIYLREFSFDDLDHLVEVKDGVGIRHRFSPRFDGMNVEERNADDQATEISLTRLGETSALKRPNGISLSFGLDENRARVKIEAADGERRSYEYDDQFRLVSQVYRDDSRVDFGDFDRHNRPETVDFPGEGRVELSRGLQGRKLSERVTFPNAPDFSSTYAHDGLGRLTESEYPGGKAIYSYDLLGPLRSARFEEAGQIFEVRYDLYSDGSVKAIHYPSGAGVGYTRSESGRLDDVAIDGAPGLVVEAYAGADLPSRQVLGGAIQQETQYDLRERTTAIRYEDMATRSLLLDLRYDLSVNGDPVAVQRVHRFGEADLFSFDAGRRLEDAWLGARLAGASTDPPDAETLESPGNTFGAAEYRRAYQFDAIGIDTLEEVETHDPGALERGPVAQSFTGRDKLLFAGEVRSFATEIDGYERTRDPLGNVTRTRLAVRPAGASGPVLVGADLVYDGKSQLRRIERDDEIRIEYEYQHTGLVYRRRVLDDEQLVSDRLLVWDRGRLIEEYDLSEGAATLRARYFYGDDDTPFAADLGPGLERHYLLRDTMGSVVAIADAQGQVQERVRYDPYGQAQIESRDDTPPRLDRIRAINGELWLEFSEAVGPRVTQSSADSGVQLASLSQALALSGPEGPLEPEVYLVPQREGFVPGAVVRLETVHPIPVDEELILTLDPDILVDAWGNAQPADEFFTFSYGGSDALLFERSGASSTAPTTRARSALGHSLLFHGQYVDYDAGLIYLRARFFDPWSAHFLQRDPAGFADSPDLYAALGHNPIAFRDPSGQTIVDDIFLPALKKNTGIDRAARVSKKKAVLEITQSRLANEMIYKISKQMSPAEVEKFAKHWARRFDESGAQRVAQLARQGGGFDEAVAVGSEFVTRAEMQAILTVAKRYDVNIFWRAGNNRVKNGNRGFAALDEVPFKPLAVKDKTGDDALVTVLENGEFKTYVSDIDIFDITDRTGASLSRLDGLKISDEINQEFQKITGLKTSPIQHGGHVGMAEVGARMQAPWLENLSRQTIDPDLHRIVGGPGMVVGVEHVATDGGIVFARQFDSDVLIHSLDHFEFQGNLNQLENFGGCWLLDGVVWVPGVCK